MINIPANLRRNNIGIRLLQAVIKFAKQQNATEFTGFIASKNALLLAKKVFGDRIKFFDDKGNQINKTYNSILADYDSMSSEFDGNIQFKAPIES